MTSTPYRLIPLGSSYIQDGYGACYLLSDALKTVKGSRTVGGFYDPGGSSERLLIRVKRGQPEKRTGTVSAEPFDGSEWK